MKWPRVRALLSVGWARPSPSSSHLGLRLFRMLNEHLKSGAAIVPGKDFVSVASLGEMTRAIAGRALPTTQPCALCPLDLFERRLHPLSQRFLIGIIAGT